MKPKQLILLILLLLSVGILFFAIQSKEQGPFLSLMRIPDKVQLIQAKPRVIPILLYHYVEYVTDERDTNRKSLNIEPHIFEQQIETLRGAGYTFITPKDIPVVLKDYSDTRYVILSFDDGYRSFYTSAYPILKKQNVPAVNYLIAGMLNQPNYLFGWQVTEMAKGGLLEVGLHGYNHQTVTSQSESVLRANLDKGLAILEELTGSKPVSYAYPYGVHDQKSIDVVKDLGLTNAVTIDKGNLVDPDKLYLIPRIRPGRTTGPTLLNLIAN